MPHTQHEKNELAKTLSVVCVLQRTYGKTKDELGILVDGFSFVLAGYSMDKIIEAIRVYVQSKPDIPTPSEILQIIDPSKREWKPDWAVYTAIKRKISQDGYYVYGEEKDFLRRCEEFAMKRSRENIENIEERNAVDLAIASRNERMIQGAA